MLWISRAAASSASRKRFLSMTPPGKKRSVKLTQPMYSDSSMSGSTWRPMMHSVEPPPMSITSRL